MRFKILLLSLFLCTAAVIFPKQSGKIAIVETLNFSASSDYDELGIILHDSLQMAVSALGFFRVESIEGLDFIHNFNGAVRKVRALQYDYCIFSTIDYLDEGMPFISLSVYNNSEGRIVHTSIKELNSYFDSFSIIDALVEDIVILFNEGKIDFATLTFENLGAKGDYSLYINQELFGTNIESIRYLPVGEYSVEIRQERMFGPYSVFKTDLNCESGEQKIVSFSIPLFTTAEESSLKDLEGIILDNWNYIEKKSLVKDSLNTLIATLQDTPYSSELLRSLIKYENWLTSLNKGEEVPGVKALPRQSRPYWAMKVNGGYSFLLGPAASILSSGVCGNIDIMYNIMTPEFEMGFGVQTGSAMFSTLASDAVINAYTITVVPALLSVNIASHYYSSISLYAGLGAGGLLNFHRMDDELEANVFLTPRLKGSLGVGLWLRNNLCFDMELAYTADFYGDLVVSSIQPGFSVRMAL